MPRLTDGALAGVAVLVGFAAGGVAGGVVWARVTETVRWLVGSDGASPGQGGLADFFEPNATFFVIGVVGGLVIGAAAGTVLRRQGPVLTLLVTVGGFLATWLAYRTGQALGPDVAGWDLDDPTFGVAPTSELVGETREGQRLTAPLAVQTIAVYLGWPIGALAAVLVVLSVLWDPADPAAAAPLRGRRTP